MIKQLLHNLFEKSSLEGESCRPNIGMQRMSYNYTNEGPAKNFVYLWQILSAMEIGHGQEAPRACGYVTIIVFVFHRIRISLR